MMETAAVSWAEAERRANLEDARLNRRLRGWWNAWVYSPAPAFRWPAAVGPGNPGSVPDAGARGRRWGGGADAALGTASSGCAASRWSCIQDRTELDYIPALSCAQLMG
ncbi:MAG: hypothetical protein IPL59_26575 [Candidatus Competibacteraceae bacterium]|nr:hypothetical protein [Candidatus Competibacteraceae bacterium]